MRTIIIADNQDITSLGIRYCLSLTAPFNQILQAANRKDLIRMLSANSEAIIILDYTLYDFTSVEELLILSERFKLSDWILFSDDLSLTFMRQIFFRSESFSIIMKDSPVAEIENAIRGSLKSERYICSQVAAALSSKKPITGIDEHNALTSAEIDILKLIALGKTTKEIAEERFSSVHTVTTHRKNIFRKIDVSSIHEATKYALRAGIIDLSDYYI